MPDDLEHQLSAFGCTLEDSVGEPLRSATDCEPILKTHTGVWRRFVGAAAIIITLAVGLSLLLRQRQSEPVTSGVEAGVPVPAAANPPPSTPSVIAAQQLEQAEINVHPAPGNVRLWVSNQSFADESVHLTIEVDGEVVVDDGFLVESQHSWIPFDIAGLQPGTHLIRAVSDTGASLADNFTLPDAESRWLVVEYWLDPGDSAEPLLTLEESDQPVRFR